MISVLVHHWFTRWIIAPLVMIWALEYAWVQYNFPTCTFRYKITAEVDTPEGPKFGSSVWDVSYSHNADWGGGETSDKHSKGRAVYIDLGQNKNVFILLTSWNSGRGSSQPAGQTYGHIGGAADQFALPLAAYNIVWALGHERRLCQELRGASSEEPVEIPSNNLPTLMTFRDIGSSATGEVVQPDSFEETFGPGYHFIKATITATGDPVTLDIERILTWWPALAERLKYRGVSNLGPVSDQVPYNSYQSNY